MPRLSADTKKQIKALSKAEMEQIVLKCAGRDKYWYEYIYVNFLDPEYGEQELFERYKQEISDLAYKQFTGRHETIRLTKLLKASNQLVKQFRQIVKQTHLEVELYLHALEIQFESANGHLGKFYQVYDNTIARTLKKVIELVLGKLHEDYLIEYQGRINGYLVTLHRLAPYNTVVRDLPQKIG